MARTLLVAMEEDIEEEKTMIQESLKLNIYDLTCMNEFMYWVGLGVYHSAIEAYGTEYAYGAHDYPTSGVFEVKPRQCPGFKFRKSLTLGTVWMGPEKFREFVEEIACEYTGDSYHLLSKNCNHFCDDVCMRLVSVRIPGWINRLANIGSLCSCLLPSAFHDDGIHPLDYFEAYRDDDANHNHGKFEHLANPLAMVSSNHNQVKFEHLANPLAMLAPKKKHIVSLSSLLYSSKKRRLFRDCQIDNFLREIEGTLKEKHMGRKAFAKELLISKELKLKGK